MLKQIGTVVLSGAIFYTAVTCGALAADIPKSLDIITAQASADCGDLPLDTILVHSTSQSPYYTVHPVPDKGDTICISYQNTSSIPAVVFLLREENGKNVQVMQFEVSANSADSQECTIPNGASVPAYHIMVECKGGGSVEGHLSASQTAQEKILFTDVSENTWYQPYITYVYENGLFSGTSKTTFSPNMQMTRAQLVTVLGNMHEKLTGTTIDAQTSQFSDVKPDMYYTKYVDWAQQNGLTAGYPDGKFHPDDTITREQMAVIINKYADKLDTVQKYNPFSDEAQISDWAKQAVENMVKYGIMTGKTGNQFAPKDAVTRAESAAVIMHLHQKLI